MKIKEAEFQRSFLLVFDPSCRCTGEDDDFVDPCFPILPIKGRNQSIRFIRSAAVCQDNAYNLKPREQINVNTAFLDASMVYGSSERVQTALRDLTSKFLSPIAGISRITYFSALKSS